MRIPLLDLVAQYQDIHREIHEAIRDVLESGQFILGPHVAALERELSVYLDVRHAIGVASGTDALVLALRALKIGPNDEVIVPAYTFFATAGAVMLAGATPVLVDIDPDTYCLDVQQVAKRITARTKAVIPVHLYGHPANMTALFNVTRSHGLKVIEDNAQAFGAEFRGRKTGSLGDVACLSFFPSKNRGGYGDGGMVTTNDGEVAEQVRMLRSHGWRKKYHPEAIGYNSRLDELQAAILRVKLHHVERWNERRRKLAQRYNEELSSMGLGVPHEAPYAKHVYHLYTVRVEDRDGLQRHLQAKGIASAIYYPQPLHLALPCQPLAYRRGDFPEAERASRETLALPLYPEMTEVQVKDVMTTIGEWIHTSGRQSTLRAR